MSREVKKLYQSCVNISTIKEVGVQPLRYRLSHSFCLSGIVYVKTAAKQGRILGHPVGYTKWLNLLLGLLTMDT